MRLYPSVPGMGRETIEETELENGLILPKGAQIVIHNFDVHRNPKYWDSPEEFRPERFTPENSQNRHTYAYIPFSAGQRNCIGKESSFLIPSRVSKQYYDCRSKICRPGDENIVGSPAQGVQGPSSNWSQEHRLHHGHHPAYPEQHSSETCEAKVMCLRNVVTTKKCIVKYTDSLRVSCIHPWRSGPIIVGILTAAAL